MRLRLAMLILGVAVPTLGMAAECSFNTVHYHYYSPDEINYQWQMAYPDRNRRVLAYTRFNLKTCECHIYIPPPSNPPTEYDHALLGHELRHCILGAFHP